MEMQRRHRNNKKSVQVRYGEDGQTPMLNLEKLFPDKNTLNPDLNFNLHTDRQLHDPRANDRYEPPASNTARSSVTRSIREILKHHKSGDSMMIQSGKVMHTTMKKHAFPMKIQTSKGQKELTSKEIVNKAISNGPRQQSLDKVQKSEPQMGHTVNRFLEQVNHF